jgi:hypothetical protein
MPSGFRADSSGYGAYLDAAVLELPELSITIIASA